LKATVTIDPYQSIGQIDPNIYGQFLSRRKYVADLGLYYPGHPDADETGLRKTVVKAIADSAPPIIRWPGGCTGTSYDWREGVGPQEGRSRTIDSHFGYDVGNGFGTVEFIEFCRRIGAEPQLNLSVGLETLRDGLEWIEYVNYAGDSKYANLRRSHGHADPFNVRYWQIGNENYGHHEIGDYTGEEYAAVAREWATAIRKFDPKLKIIAVGAMAKHNVEWDLAVLDKAWGKIDYITAHRYWNFNPESAEDSYDAIAAVGCVEERNIIALTGLINYVATLKGDNERIPRIAFTEWGCRNTSLKEMSAAWKPHRTQYRMVEALAVAGFINAMQRQCNSAALGNFAQSINVVGMLTVTEDRVVKETLYWPLLMQRIHSGPTAVGAQVRCDGYSTTYNSCHIVRPVENIPYLDVSATMDKAKGKLYISAINRHRHEEAVTRLRLVDTTPKPDGRLYRLFHEDPLAFNTLDEPDNVVPEETAIAVSGNDFELSLPPHSYSIFELEI
jgi:alpha-N-arabinofuranosidase